MSRPKYLRDIIGQDRVMKVLEISTKSALIRKEPLSHSILSGGAGLGKTTFAQAIANEFNADIQISNGGNIQSIKQALKYISRIEEDSFFFIDEIHRIPIKVEEFLYPVMEDFRCDIEGGTSVKIPKFTLVGATTDFGALSKPLRDRFKCQFRLELYSVDSLEKIIKNYAEKIEVGLDDSAVTQLAQISRGTPRIAISYLEWVRDYLISLGLSCGSEKDVLSAMSLKQIDREGFTNEDRQYLSILSRHKPVGLDTIASSTGISKNTIACQIEPFLLHLRKISIEKSGRILV
jgi:Holliday junction DNA helicase RuvB